MKLRWKYMLLHSYAFNRMMVRHRDGHWITQLEAYRASMDVRDEPMKMGY